MQIKIGKPTQIDNELIVWIIVIVGLVVTDCTSNTAVKGRLYLHEDSAPTLNALRVSDFLSAEVIAGMRARARAAAKIK